MIIAISGKARSGKDTAADYLRDKYGYEPIRFSAPVYSIVNYIQKTVGVPNVKDPAMLQFIGENLRQYYGEDVWVGILLRSLQPDKNIVICDARLQIEANELAAAGIPILRINRKERPIDRDPSHISEVDLDNYPFNYVIDNDGTFEEFYAKIDEFITQLN